MPSVIVPVGLSMGPRFRYVRPPDPVPECFEVHLADDVAELSAGEFAAWGAAFLEPERHARLEIDRASLVRFLATAPRPEPRAADLVTVLVERGLLLELDTDGPLENVFSQHKLLPLGEGIGSTAEDPHLYRVAQAGRPSYFRRRSSPNGPSRSSTRTCGRRARSTRTTAKKSRSGRSRLA